MFQIERRGKIRLSDRGMLAVARRRDLSNMATSDFGAALFTDRSHQPVARCETEIS